MFVLYIKRYGVSKRYINYLNCYNEEQIKEKLDYLTPMKNGVLEA